MHELKPYPEYKDSGVPWLGQVPAHWEVKPNRALFKEVKSQNHPNEPLLSVTISRGVIRQDELLSDTSKKDSSNLDKSKYKLVRPGEIAYNKMRAWQGAIGLSRYRGIVSPAYIIQRPRPGVIGEFMHYLFRTPGFAKEAERWSYGITSDQWSLRPEHFKMIYSCLPPAPEQAAIVRYLDYVDRRIRRYIRAQQRLIKLLEEQKQALIHQAVTGQIDVRTGQPYPAYKDSGVEWLGQVPAGWEVVPLKHVANVQTGITLGKNYQATPTVPHPYLRVANVQHGKLDLSEIKTINVPATEAQRAMLKPGDVLMTEGGDIDKLGRGCVWNGEVANCLHQNHIFAVRCIEGKLVPKFLVGLMISGHGRAYFQLTAKQTTNLASTNSTTLRAFPILLPTVAEQHGILQYLDQQSAKIDTAMDATHHEIDLLNEYRTRLIADVVTGKVDVRAVAAQLPEEADEPTPPEDEAEIDTADVLEMEGEEPVLAAD